MRSFKDYTPKNNTNTQKSKQEPKTASAEELTRRIASAYNGKSNADMLRDILQEAEKSKRAGTLSNEEIENFYQAFAPMLDGAQARKLRVIVEKLKMI